MRGMLGNTAVKYGVLIFRNGGENADRTKIYFTAGPARSTVPLSTGTAVHVLFRFLPSRRFFAACFCDHGLDFREISYCEIIITIT